MPEGTLRIKVLFALIIFSLASVLGATRARADALVGLYGFGFSPDPVTIFPGDVVAWTDAGGGPSGIYADDNSWSTATDAGTSPPFAQTGSYGYYDDYGDQGTIIVVAYSPPTVSITAPANGAVLAAPATFDFSADASSPIGISDVEFYVGTNLVDDVFGTPYTTTVTNLPAGHYTLEAIAYDNDFDSASASISITVTGSAPPPALKGQVLGNQIVMSWNTNNATGLSLHFTTDLTSGSWTAVSTTPTQIGGQMVVTNPMVGPRGFFRLSNH